jgi:hypothetical protein
VFVIVKAPSDSAARSTPTISPIDAIQFCLREAGLTIEDVREIAHGFDYSRFRQLYSPDPDSDGLYDEVVANSRAFAQPTLSNSVTALRLFAGKNLQSHQRGFPRTAGDYQSIL